MARKPRPIQTIIGSSRGLRPLLAQARDQARITELVRNNLPPPLPEHTLGTRIKGKELLIYTDSPAWSSRLRFCSRNLQQQLLEKGLKIQRIRVRVNIDIQRPAPEHRSMRKLSSANARLLEETACSIAAPGLSAALRRLARHQRT